MFILSSSNQAYLKVLSHISGVAQTRHWCEGDGGGAGWGHRSQWMNYEITLSFPIFCFAFFWGGGRCAPAPYSPQSSPLKIFYLEIQKENLTRRLLGAK